MKLSVQDSVVVDAYYLAIKNDQPSLEKVFFGLFVVARRFLGYSPPNSSAPFITSRDYTEKEAAWATERGGKVVLEDADAILYNRRFFVVSGSSAIAPMGAAILKALGTEDAMYFNLDTRLYDYIAAMLFTDYFSDMMLYANSNRYYRKDWQSVVSTLKLGSNPETTES